MKPNWPFLFSVVLWLVTMAWGASSFASTLQAVQSGQRQQSVVLDRIVDKLATHEVDIAILKTKVK